MKRWYGKSSLAALALGALATLPGPAARADDALAEIRALKARLKQLETKFAQQEKKRKEAAAPATVTQQPIYSIPKIPGSSDQKALIGLGLPGAPPSYETGGPAGREAKIEGQPYVGPSSFFINQVSITPGGFFELATVTRDHFIGADIATPWQNIPFPNVPTTHAAETHFSARRSRLAALVRGDIDPTTHLSGYGEFDFLGAAQTANLNQTDSFNFRIRHLYLDADYDDLGLHFLAGHAFTLATMNTVGILPRKENTPIVIEDQYVPGFVWARQDQLRITKDFDKKIWLSLSVEQPATSFGGTAPNVPTVINVLPGAVVPAVGANPAPNNANGVILGGSLYNSVNPLSLNQFPDVIGKAAWDFTIADRTIHVEGFGVLRSEFVDRVIYPFGAAGAAGAFAVTSTNKRTSGGGGGGSILVPVLPKVLEAQFSGMTGRGIGRYGAAQLPDVTFNPDGSLAPINETLLLAGLIWHPMPGLDLYAYAGEEFQHAKYGFTPLGTNNFVGWGNPFFNNSGCQIEFSVVCSGNVQRIQQITGGFWNDIYKGPFGRLTGGLQYSFTQKFAFPGLGFAPRRDENMAFASIRYYPF